MIEIAGIHTKNPHGRKIYHYYVFVSYFQFYEFQLCDLWTRMICSYELLVSMICSYELLVVGGYYY